MTAQNGQCVRTTVSLKESVVAAGLFTLGPGANDPIHFHHCHQVSFCEDNDVQLRLQDKTVPVRPGTAVLVPSGTQHVFASASARRIRCFYFNAALPVIAISTIDLSQLTQELMFEVLRHGISERSKKLVAACLYDQLGSLLQNQILDGASLSNPLKAVCSRILSSPGCPISVADLAQDVFVSERKLRRLAMSELGCSIVQFRTRCRVFEAMRLLQCGTPTKQIVTHVGFSSESAFYSAFRCVSGMTPSEFKRGQSA